MSTITTYNDAPPPADGTKTAANKVTYASITTNLTDPIKNFVEANVPLKGVSGTAPTVTDDGSDGYEIGSTIVDTASGIVYMCTDETAGAAVWKNISEPFPSGTRMFFQQATVPSGWTIDTTLNNAMIRVVDGSTQTFETVLSPGGTDVFTTVFSDSKTTDNFTLLKTHLPPHVHTGGANYNGDQTTSSGSNAGGGAVTGDGAADGLASTPFAIDITLDPIFCDTTIGVKD